MAAALCHTRDVSHAEQYRLTHLFPPPDFVKQASHEQLCGEPDALPRNIYADPAELLYPCHSKAATWMSCCFFADKKSQLPPVKVASVEARLRKSAAFFGITNDVKALWEKMASGARHEETSLPDEDFALVWQDEGSNETQRHYPLRNPAEIEKAASWFNKYQGEFDYEDRQQIASKLLEAAERHRVKLADSERLCRTAGFGICNPQSVADGWKKRATLMTRKSPELAAAASKQAELVLANPASLADHTTRVKMAGLLDQFDRVHGLTQLYDAGGLVRPEELIFQFTEKQAKDMAAEHIELTTGAIYEKAELEKFAVSDVRDWLGDELAAEVSLTPNTLDTEKLASTLRVLPRPDAAHFEKLAASRGIKPVARTKGAAIGFSLEELRQLQKA